MSEKPEDASLTIAATVAGIATLVAFGGVLFEFWLRRTMGWHHDSGSKWATRLGATVALAGLGILGMQVGARLLRERRRKGLVLVGVTAAVMLLFGILCLMDETVRAETAILFDGSGPQRPWELSLAHKPNLWLRYQLLRGCGAACIVTAFGVMGSAIRE